MNHPNRAKCRCPECWGSGEIKIAGPCGTITCGRCGGEGRISISDLTTDEIRAAFEKAYR